MPLIIVRYGEIGLKSRGVRRRFEDVLLHNIHEAFLAAKLECLTERERGRIYVRVSAFKPAAKALQRVFGIVSFSEVVESTSELAELCDNAAEFATGVIKKGESFAVRATRTGSHPYTSMDVGREAGSSIYESMKYRGIKVNLTDPDRVIRIEVRERRAYLFSDAVRGPGGLPLGSQGKVLAVLERKIDAVAAWLMMRRGCKAVLLCDSEGVAKPLKVWDPNLRTAKLEGDSIGALAGKMRCDAVISGTLADGVGSPKPECDLPTIFPLVGLSRGEIASALALISKGVPPRFGN